MTTSACVYVPLPDTGHLSGRAVIADDDMRSLKAGEGVITRKQVLLMLGEPNERYNRDKYFCYAWERMIGLWLIAAGGPYGPAGVGGDFVGKDHWLCMQFAPDTRLVHVEHIEPLSGGDEEKERVLHGWNQSGSGDELKITYDYYNLDMIKHEVFQSMAVKGFPEAQWKLYAEFGKKRDDVLWLCRSADNGYTKAQLEVGRIYWSASHIPLHKVKAFVWYRLASSNNGTQGAAMDRKTLSMAEDAMREAVNELNNEQLIEAYQLYTEWEQGNCELELLNSKRV